MSLSIQKFEISPPILQGKDAQLKRKPKRRWESKGVEILKRSLSPERSPSNIDSEKQFKKRKWTEKEDQQLITLLGLKEYPCVEKYALLGQKLERSAKAIKNRWFILRDKNGNIDSEKQIQKRKWTKKEDQQLITSLHQSSSQKKYALLSQKLEGSACSKKRRSSYEYLVHSYRPWTEEDDNELLRLKKSNDDFKSIGLALERAPIACKFRYFQIRAKKS